jgi:glucuronosyltransferase
MPGKSHMAVNVALVKELAYRGHEVTVISPFPENKTIPNYKDIVLDSNIDEKFFSMTGK